MLPKLSGLEVLKQLRDDRHNSPVLMLTAKDTTNDRITGLDSGADDYLVKPFSLSELLPACGLSSVAITHQESQQ